MTIQNYSDNVILVELPPEPQIREEIDRVMEIARQRPDCDVVVDFSKVDVVVSLSLSGFLQLHRFLAESGRRLIFFNAAALTRNIFKAICFDGIFEFAEDLSEATNRLNATTDPATYNS